MPTEFKRVHTAADDYPIHVESTDDISDVEITLFHMKIVSVYVA
jgi:hypothetical protein